MPSLQLSEGEIRTLATLLAGVNTSPRTSSRDDMIDTIIVKFYDARRFYHNPRFTIAELVLLKELLNNINLNTVSQDTAITVRRVLNKLEGSNIVPYRGW